MGRVRPERQAAVSSTTGKAYDAKTCVTAGELRAAGFTIPDDIPNVGWVPRRSITWDGDVSVEEIDHKLRASVTLRFTEPFRWIMAAFKMERHVSG